MRGPGPLRKKVGEPRPMRLQGSDTYEPTEQVVLLDILFVLFQVKRGSICQFTVVHFDFCFDLIHIFVSLCMYNQEIFIGGANKKQVSTFKYIMPLFLKHQP